MNKNYQFVQNSLNPNLGKRTKTQVVHWICSLMLLFGLTFSQVQAQIAVTVTNPTNTTPNLAPTYTSLANALSALNATTAMSGSVTLTLDPGQNETAPSAAGFILGSATLNPVLSATNTITIIKAAGAATILNAATGGTGTPSTATPDGIFSIRGADFVTIDGLTFTDGNAANPATMEFGVGLFKAGAGDGANNNTIQNCIFNMQRINNASSTAPMVEGAVAILAINATAITATTALTPTNGGTSATNGTNSNNKFYTNTINGGNYGIVLSGFAATVGVGAAPVATTFLGDLGNDIGGIATLTGNTILNFGGAASATNPSAGIRANNQWSVNISFNTINNNNGTGVNHISTLRGIFAQAGTSANANINNNTITVLSASTSSLVTAIDNGIGATPLTNTVNINNNTIINCAVTGVASSSAFTGINNTASCATLNINTNIVRGYASTATTGGFTGITNTGGIGTAISINNNGIGDAISGAFAYSVATSGTINGISSTGTLLANATISISNNDFRGFVYNVLSTSAINPINITGATAAGNIATIQNNTFTNLNVNTTGTITLITQTYSASATGVKNTNNNSIVTAFIRAATATSGTLLLISDNGSSAAGCISNCQNNNFSNITVSGASIITGLNYTDGGTAPTRTVTGNALNNWTVGTGTVIAMNFTYWNGVSTLSNNTITNILGQGIITGLNIGSTANNATSVLISGNTINNLISSGTGGSVTGIACSNTSTGIVITNNVINTLSSTGTTASIHGITIGATNAAGTTITRNKIYDLSGNQAGTLVNGINVTAATLVNISNNLIADLRATAATSLNAINGINASATATYNIFYNTINLNAISSGTTFGSSAVLFTSVITSFNLRNNILVNTSTPGATGGITAVLRRSGGTNGTVPATYATTSNNNLYWVNPTAGVTNYLTYVEGTSTITNPMNTFAQMKAFMGNRDQNSVTENIAFVSNLGANVDFLRPTGATQAESGGAVIAGLTDAYNGLGIRTGYPLTGQINGGGFSPDMGAYEGDFIYTDITPPNITYTPLSNICVSTPSRVLVATIVDVNGVPTTGAGLPMLYWRINTNPYVGVQGVSLGANQYQFTFGGATVGTDVVSYYIVAQDNFATSNIGAFPAVGAGGFSTNPPAAVTPPTTPTTYTHGAGLAGTYTVGVTGNYPTLTAAVAAFNAGCATGAVIFELIDANYPSEPLFPIVINQIPNASTNTLTIRPSATVGAVNFVGANANSLIDLNGADYITINGTNGTSTLTISNTAQGATANTIRLFGDATFNTITNTTLLGSGNALGAAIINLGAVVTTGNNNNTISNNTIGAAGANFPTSGILSFSASGVISNNQNTVTGNNFVDIFNAASEFSAININNTNNAWTVTNNRIYQTAPRTITAAHISVGISVFSGAGHTISGNIIGFANATGTGTTSYTSTANFNYNAIAISGLVAGAVNNIQGNTITNISLTTASSTSGSFIAISLAGAGDVNIGTTTPNIIGATTGNDAISVTSSVSGGTIFGIRNAATGIINISNNIVGSMTAIGSSATIALSINAINSTGGTATITNNVVGSTTTANSINAITNTTGSTQNVYGIIVTTTSLPTNISNNIVANLNQNSTTTSAFIRGILYSGSGDGIISGNTVRNISGANVNTTQATVTGVQGIVSTAFATNITISQNTIFSVFNTNTGAVATNVSGIGNANSTNAFISKNRIYDIRNASTGVSATTPPTAVGILLRFVGNVTVANNMISLGDAQATNTAFVGISNTGDATPNIIRLYHNSVYISGTVTTGSLPSFGFSRSDFSTTAVPTPMDIRNNIFYNIRSGGTGAHYAIGNNFGATTSSATGWGANASNYNVLYASNPANIGHWTTARTFAAWQTASASDANSLSNTINFTNPTIGDLHIATPYPSIVEATGINIPTVTDDFDADIRASNSPVDIGADAGNFSNVVILYTPLASNCATGARTLTATITSANGVPTSGAGLPVLYWRINVGAYQASTATSLGGNQYQFSLGTGSVANDVISYYVVAQDLSGVPNVSAFPSTGASGFSANVPAVTTPPATPSTYLNTISLSGTYLVGAGQTYTTLTAAVNAYNIACLTGAVTFALTDATYSAGETFPIVINENPQANATNTLTIRPNTGVTASISGSNVNSIININGAKFVIIDGSNGGTTRNLTISNTNVGVSSAVVWVSPALTNSSNIEVRNANIVGNASTTTLFGLGAGGNTISTTSTGANNNISFVNNNISAVQLGIYTSGVNATTKNQNFVANNNLMNTASPGNVGLTGIFANFTNNITVSGNTINGIVNASSSDVSGINIGGTSTGGFSTTSTGTSDGVSNVTISNNTIGTITQSGTFSAVGIFLGNTATGTSTIFNNAVYGVSSNGTGGDFGGGIVVGGGTANINVYYNTVSMQGTVIGGTSATQNSVCFGVTSATAPANLNVRQNVFSNTQLGNAGATTLRISAIALSYPAPFSGIINNNDLWVNGAGPGVYAIGYTGGFGGTAQTTLANWRTATGYDITSLNVNPIFTSATNLLPTACALDNKGVTIAGITTDILAVTRNVTTPDMGAFEFTAILDITPNTLPNGTLNVAYSQALTQTGILGTITWSVSAGALPTGITISSTTGALSGTPSVAGTFNITVQATDGTCTTTKAYTLVINCPTITFGTAPGNGTVGVAYSQTVTQTGLGTPVWSISTGTLPTGTTINPATGEIAGNPTVAGTYTFTVQATQSTCSNTQSYTVIIGCPTITVAPVTLPNGIVNTLYAGQVISANAVGLTGAYTIALTSGSAPGMSFNTGTNTWEGTPTAQGTYPLVFTVTNTASTCSTTMNYSFVVTCSTVTINPTTLANATVGTGVTQVISQTGALPPFTWSVSAGTLPTGVTFDATTATLSGTPTVTGTYNFTISIDLGGCSVPQPYTWVVVCPAITFPNTVANAATVGTAYNLNASATGTTATPTYSVNPALPAGLSINAATGAITGTPTTATASNTYTVTVSQAGICTQTQAYTFAVNCPTITISPATTAIGFPNVAYTQNLTVAGNTSAVTWSVTTGVLPIGLTLDATTGVISGTPGQSGNFPITVTATQAVGGCTGTQNYTVAINCPVTTISPVSAVLPQGTATTPYPSTTFTQVGLAGAVTWSVIAGTLPPGLTIAANGTLSGTPTLFGTYNFTVGVTQGINLCSASKLYNLVIISPCTFMTPAPPVLPAGNVNAAYTSTTITTSGGVAPYTYAVSNGALPAGLTLTTAGVLSGTPTAQGTFNVNITATDAIGCKGSITHNIVINAACTAISFTNTSLANGTIGVLYNQAIAVTGGVAPYTFSLASGTLPVGLQLTSGGVVAGTPTVAGASSFTVKVTDAIGCSNTQVISVTINPQPTSAILLSGSLNFGSVLIGQTSILSFTIQNTGNAPLNISGISYPAGFTGSFVGTLLPNAIQTVTVIFSPTALINYTGNVTVASNANSGTNTIPISGVGIGAVPTAVSPANTPQITVYPNPTTDFVEIKFENGWNGDYEVKVLDMNGRSVLENKTEVIDTLRLDFRNLSNGTYLLQLETKKGKKVVRVVKN